MSNDTLVLFSAPRDTLELLPPEGGTLRLVPVADTLQLQVAVGGGAGAGTGDMLKSIYDPDADGVVIQADTITSQGDAATKNVGTTAGTVAAGDHTHTGVYQPADADLTAWAAVNPSSYSTTAEIAAAYQPLDSDLTAIAALADPNADRMLFWDDSAGAYKYLIPGTGLTITDTTIDASGAGATTALDNLASVAINTSLLPATNDGAALGDGTHAFSDLFLAAGGVINWNNGAVTITESSGNLTFSSAVSNASYIFTFAGDFNSFPTVEIGGSGLGDGLLRLRDNSGASVLLLDGDASLIQGNGSTSVTNIASISTGTLSATTTVTADELKLRETSGAGSQTLSLLASETLSANRVLNFEVGDADKTVTFGATGTYRPSGATLLASGSFPAANNLNITDIPATYAYLFLVIIGASCGTATRQIFIRYSVDNGSSFGATLYSGYNVNAGAVVTNGTVNAVTSATLTAAQTADASLSIFNYHGGGYPILSGAIMTNTSGTAVPYVQHSTWYGSTNNIDAIQIIWNAAGDFDAGAYALYGVA